MLSDLQYALRLVRGSPAFSVVAGLTLALGIGANTALFSILDAALFRPLPLREPDQLVDLSIDLKTPSGAVVEVYAPGSQAGRVRQAAQVIAAVSAYTAPHPMALASGVDDSPLVGGMAPSFLSLLGVSPQLGRAFAADDVAAGTVLISDAYWRRVFAASPDVLGQTLTFVDRTCIIVGVLPASWRYLGGDVWRAESEADSGLLLARLRPGLTVDQAQRALDAALGRKPGDVGHIGVHPTGASRLPDSTRTMLWLLLGAVGFLLLIACANVANLLLARTLGRQREIAVRGALGGSRARLARQFLAEGLVLAGLGGIAALGVAWAALRAVPAMLPPNLVGDLFKATLPALDARVLLVGLAVVLASGLLCSVLPALRAARTPAGAGLLSGGRRLTGMSVTQRRVQGAVQALQVALTLILLAGAGLLVTSFVRLTNVPMGFDAADLGYVTLASAPQSTRNQAGRQAFMDSLLLRVAAVPGVMRVAAGALPVSGYGLNERFVPVEAGEPVSSSMPANWFYAGRDYFTVTGIPLLEGRPFGPEDASDEPPVAIVSENAAHRFWPGQSAIGRHFRLTPLDRVFTVVGVVANVKTVQASRDAMDAYLPATDFTGGLVFRTRGNVSAVVPALRAAIGAVPGARIVRIGTVAGYFAEHDPMVSPRFYSLVLSLFAGMALVTAAVGLFALLSFSVGRRVHEIGVRIALGADVARIRAFVLGEVLTPVAVGLVAGLLGTLWLSRLIAAQLFQVTPHDPWVLLTVASLLLVVSAVAVLVPVRRATRIDPAEALRAE